MAIAGCAINPSRVTAVAPDQNFAAMSCEQLASESSRITKSYEDLRWSNEAGTRNKLARLNGETAAVNDAIRMNGCKLASVHVPGNATVESHGGYETSQKQ